MKGGWTLKKIDNGSVPVPLHSKDGGVVMVNFMFWHNPDSVIYDFETDVYTIYLCTHGTPLIPRIQQAFDKIAEQERRKTPRTCLKKYQNG